MKIELSNKEFDLKKHTSELGKINVKVKDL